MAEIFFFCFPIFFPNMSGISDLNPVPFVLFVFLGYVCNIFLLCKPIYILIRDGYPISAFAAHLHLQMHMPMSSLSSYLAA